MSHSYMLTSAMLKAGVVYDFTMTSTPNVLTTNVTSYTTIVLTTHFVNCFLIYPIGWIRVCEIRFVSTGENHRKPGLVCKKYLSEDCSVYIAPHHKNTRLQGSATT